LLGELSKKGRAEERAFGFSWGGSSSRLQNQIFPRVYTDEGNAGGKKVRRAGAERERQSEKKSYGREKEIFQCSEEGAAHRKVLRGGSNIRGKQFQAGLRKGDLQHLSGGVLHHQRRFYASRGPRGKKKYWGELQARIIDNFIVWFCNRGGESWTTP